MKKDGVIKPYEVLWFMDHNGIISDWFEKTFKTKKQALRYYNRHKKMQANMDGQSLNVIGGGNRLKSMLAMLNSTAIIN